MAASEQTLTSKQIETLAINTIRTLSIDGVQKANSGHPGAPMGLAPTAYTLFQRYLKYDPKNPLWPNRDRFVLSAGHASMLLYSMLYLTGVKAVDAAEEKVLDQPAVSLDDIKQFRQLDSKTPGHPEFRITGGVETTTGPLGQGVVEDGKVICPWHGWQYDPKTGQAAHSAAAKVAVHAIKVEGEEVLVEI